MIGALVAGGIVAYLVVYFAIGWSLAKRDLPHLWVRARQEWHSDEYARGDVKVGTLVTLFFWPVRLPFIRALSIVDTLDPKQIAAERDAQALRIAELERELRIERRP